MVVFLEFICCIYLLELFACLSKTFVKLIVGEEEAWWLLLRTELRK